MKTDPTMDPDNADSLELTAEDIGFFRELESRLSPGPVQNTLRDVIVGAEIRLRALADKALLDQPGE